MAIRLTKNIKPVRDYQVWTTADMTNGDILGVSESLGHRVANSVTLESNGGASTVKFNVATEVYARHAVGTVSGVLHNTFVGLGNGALRSSPHLVGEVEDTTQPSIVIDNGTSQTWLDSEIGIRDIKIVLNSGLKITVT